MRRKKRSMTRIYWIALVVLLLVCILDILVRNQTQKEINRTMEAFYDSAVSEKMESLRMRLSGIGKSMTNVIYEGSAIERIEKNGEGIARISAINKIQEIFYKYQTIAGNQVHMFMVDRKQGDFIQGSSGVYDYVELLAIEKAVLQAVDEDVLGRGYGSNRWDCLNVDGTPYFVKLYDSQSGESYIGCWVRAWDMLDFISSTDIYGSQKTFIIDGGGSPLNAPDYDEALGNIYRPENTRENFMQVRDNHLIYHVFPQLCNFSVVITLDTIGIYGSYMTSRQFFWAMSAAIFILGLLLIFYTKRRVIRPIVEMSAHLESFTRENSGDLYAFDELNQMSEAIGHLYDQVESLKLAALQQEIEKDEIRLSFLQQQIRPHFYINCLDIIYNMAQSGRYAQIQALAREVSGYLRSTFREGTEVVPLCQEVELVDGYMNIFRIRYEDDFDFHKYIDNRAGGCRVPPMLIQTLVENALKHNVMRRSFINISLYADITEEGRGKTLVLRIEDDGVGMAPELMEKLNRGEMVRKENGKSIGLWNLLQRIRYIYRGNCSIYFKALSGGGTSVTVQLPVNGGVSHESVDGR